MVTYKSRYSAEDLDNTIGLVHGLVVPHVGDNGNWFVGETDMGVFAKGIDVTGAEVGQIVKVTEIDEDGRPLAWESVDMPGENWEFINEVTTKADVSNFVVKMDANGKSFALKKVFVHIHQPIVETVTTAFNTRICLSGNQIGYYGAFGCGMNPSTANSGGKKIYLIAECIEGKIVLIDGKFSANYNAAMNDLSSNFTVYNGGYEESAAITQVAYGSYSVVVAAGTTMTIYGVRQ